MRTRSLRARFGPLMLSIAAAIATTTEAERPARAEADNFGLGDGHHGAFTASQSQQVVNAYAPLREDVALGATRIPIGSVVGHADSFQAGDLILVWRATGLAAAQATSGPSRIDLAAVGGAGGPVGRYEFARVTEASATELIVTRPLVHAWAAHVTQVVKIREYTTLSVPQSTSLSPHPWSSVGPGFAGGILAFLARGAVTLEGRLDADGRGFRGGAAFRRLQVALSCPNDDGAPASGYAHKGEGIVHTAYGSGLGGRASRANGGGGGNCVTAGGGGGGNFGAGGDGGQAAVVGPNPGRGGVGLEYSLLERISLGGGGGAGESKDTLAGGGGNGGGAILARVQTLAGAGQVSAAGVAAQNTGVVGSLLTDGAGGGGAGGSVLLRIAGNAECDGLVATGGNGASTNVIVLPSVLGPGGGGGGGRVLIQAASHSPNCVPDVTPGGPGTGGPGAGGGGGGAEEPPPTGAFCTGPFGSGPAPACQIETHPVCVPDGSCKPCNGDFGSGATQACQLFGLPTCFAAALAGGPSPGACAKCTSDDHCVGAGHAGPKCHQPHGVCGQACTGDSDCKDSEWCSQNVCIPKTPNGEPLPNVPPIAGECTRANGERVCVSEVCEPDDDRCGLKNESPCEGVNERCRSNICFPADRLCGKPDGEPCNDSVECRSDVCKEGRCHGCASDAECPANSVCDRGKCEEGCRPGGPLDGGAGRGACPEGQRCVPVDGGALGRCEPDGSGGGDGGAGDAGTGGDFGAGIIEGGGCACSTKAGAASSPLALVAAAVSLWLARRRRARRG